VTHTEYRDDRFVAVFDRWDDKQAIYSVAYMVRAVSPGRYIHPPAVIEDMYRPEKFGRTAYGQIEVTGGEIDAITVGRLRAWKSHKGWRIVADGFRALGLSPAAHELLRALAGFTLAALLVIGGGVAAIVAGTAAARPWRGARALGHRLRPAWPAAARLHHG
jgi:hypothetical protein